MTGLRGLRLGLLISGLLVVALLVVVLLRRPGEDAAVPTIPARQATAVAQAAADTVAESRLGDATAVAVSAGGTFLVAAPATVGSETSAQLRLPGGTEVAGRVHSDPLSGIAAVDVDRATRTALPLGSSAGLRPGQQLVLAPAGGAPSLRVTYVGRNSVMLERYGLGQYVLELALPAGASAGQGVVLDAEGRLVALVVPDRQQGAPAGHVFAVPVEQAADLFTRLGVGPTPTPGTPPLPPLIARELTLTAGPPPEED